MTDPTATTTRATRRRSKHAHARRDVRPVRSLGNRATGAVRRVRDVSGLRAALACRTSRRAIATAAVGGASAQGVRVRRARPVDAIPAWILASLGVAPSPAGHGAAHPARLGPGARVAVERSHRTIRLLAGSPRAVGVARTG